MAAADAFMCSHSPLLFQKLNDALLSALQLNVAPATPACSLSPTDMPRHSPPHHPTHSTPPHPHPIPADPPGAQRRPAVDPAGRRHQGRRRLQRNCGQGEGQRVARLGMLCAVLCHACFALLLQPTRSVMCRAYSLLAVACLVFLAAAAAAAAALLLVPLPPAPLLPPLLHGIAFSSLAGAAATSAGRFRKPCCPGLA